MKEKNKLCLIHHNFTVISSNYAQINFCRRGTKTEVGKSLRLFIIITNEITYSYIVSKYRGYILD